MRHGPQCKTQFALLVIRVGSQIEMVPVMLRLYQHQQYGQQGDAQSTTNHRIYFSPKVGAKQPTGNRFLHKIHLEFIAAADNRFTL